MEVQSNETISSKIIPETSIVGNGLRISDLGS